MSGNRSRSTAVTSLYNSNGIVQYDPTSILRVMQVTMDHWQPTPQATRWTCNIGMIVSLFKSFSIQPPIRNSDILDQDFSWNQIAAALLQMNPRKASGDDDIPLRSTKRHSRRLPTPKKAFHQLHLLVLFESMWSVFASATILCAWLCESIVSVDKKEGDPLNPGDK
ncbi:hypothetical protein BASA83_012223 [Batrachochytrium salamandrivorans]|nr:hypothetical protein BASA83_012223 [Batrachochytrium salamandrivorans]